MSERGENLEIEAKFTAPDATTLERLAAVGELAGYAIAGGEVADMTDAYLDTADRALGAALLMCRRRDRGDRVEITVKRQSAAIASEAAVHRREEYEFVLPAGLAPEAPPGEWPSGKARDLVLAAAGAKPLTTLAEGRQHRLLRAISRDGREVAELSLDTFTIVARGEALPPQYEVEIELKGHGTESDLAAIATALQTGRRLSPQPLSKYERALAALDAAESGPSRAADLNGDPSGGGEALLDADEERLVRRIARRRTAVGRRARALLALHEGSAQTDAATRAGLAPRTVRYWLNRYRSERLGVFPARLVAQFSERLAAGPAPDTRLAAGAATVKVPSHPGIRAGDTMADAAFKTLRFHFAIMRQHEPGTRSGDDPEDLHDMRVATRRMRAALRVFGPYLDPKVMQPVERGLKRTGRVLGAVRDLDVFSEKTLHYLETLPEERHSELDSLLEVWRERREHARAQMIDYLDGPRYARFLDEFSSLLDDPGRAGLAVVGDDGEARPHRVTLTVPAALYDRVTAVWAYDDVIDGPDTPLVRFHRLRIAGKAMRYTFEFFEEVLGREAKPLIKATKGMQDHLGDLQDAVVSCTILRNFLTWGTWEPPAGGARRATPVVVAPGVAAYMAARQGELRRLVETFPEMWVTIGGDVFRTRLARVVGSL